MDLADNVSEVGSDFCVLASEDLLPSVESGLTRSQYAQVLFHDVDTCPGPDEDRQVRFSLNDPDVLVAAGDWIGLFRLPYTATDQTLVSLPVDPSTDTMHSGIRTVTLPHHQWPEAPPGYYQYQYLRADGTSVGASVGFHWPPASHEAQPQVQVLNDELLNLTSLSGAAELAEESTTGPPFLINPVTEVPVIAPNVPRSQDMPKATMSQGTQRAIEVEAQGVQTTMVSDTEEKIRAIETHYEGIIGILRDDLESLARKKGINTGLIPPTNSAESQKNAELERSLEYLRANCQTLEKETKVLQKERGYFQEMLARLQSDHSQSRTTLSSTQTKLEEALSMLGAMTKSKDMAVQEIQKLMDQKEQLRSENEKLRKSFSDEASKVNNLEDCLSILGKKHESLEMAKEQIQRTCEDLTLAAMNTESKLTEDLTEANALVEDLRGRIIDLEITERQTKAKSTVPTRQAPASKIEELELLVRDLQVGLRESEALHSQELRTLKDEFEELKSLASYAPSVTSSTNFMENSMIERKINEIMEKAVHVDTHRDDFSFICEENTQMLNDLYQTGTRPKAQSPPTEPAPIGPEEVVISDDQPKLDDAPGQAQKELVPVEIFEKKELKELIAWAENVNQGKEEDTPPERAGEEELPKFSFTDDGRLIPAEPKPVPVCPLCNVEFPDMSIAELELHVDGHLSDKSQCPMCNAEFNKNDPHAFHAHVQKHFLPEEDPFSNLSDFSLIDETSSMESDDFRPSVSRGQSQNGNGPLTKALRWLQNID